LRRDRPVSELLAALSVDLHVATRRGASNRPRNPSKVFTRPTMPIRKPDGRYRWVPSDTEQETVPPRGRAIAKFEVTRTIKRRLKP